MYNGQKRAPKGASTNAREALEGCWATLAVDPATGKPVAITLHMAVDEPLVLSRFSPGTSRKANASQWIAQFDPESLYHSKRELATLRRHLADERGLEKYSPSTAVGARVAAEVLPVMEFGRPAEHRGGKAQPTLRQACRRHPRLQARSEAGPGRRWALRMRITNVLERC